MVIFNCEYDKDFDGIIAKALINGDIHWIGQQLDATDEEKVFRIGPDCWELFDGETDYTVKKPISQELFDEAIRLAADKLNIYIL